MSADDFTEDFTDYERQILANIDAHGCHITSIMPDEADLGHVPFAYSTGFVHTVDQGEVIIFGLSGKLMAAMINDLLRMCRDDHFVLRDGEPVAGLLDGFDVIARKVAPTSIEREHFNSAMWHHARRYGTPLAEAWQLVWPSAYTGLFPWDSGCEPDVIALQPALYQTSIH